MSGVKRDLRPRIGIISDERFPFQGTNTQQILKNAAALSAIGLAVEIIVPLQLQAMGQTTHSYVNSIHKYYHLTSTVKIRQVFGIPAKIFRFEKFTHGLVAPFYLFFKGFDLAYTRNRLPFLLSLILGKKVIFETYRCLSTAQPVFAKILKKLARIPNFIGVITHSQVAANSIRSAGVPSEKIKVIHNGFDPRDMEPVLGKQEARVRLGLTIDQTLVVYAGNMGKNKGIESVITMAKEASSITFVMIGATPERLQVLQGEARQKGVNNILFLGRKSISEVSNYLYAADLLLIPPSSAPLYLFGKTVLPFKTFIYLAAGRPILAPDTPDLKEILCHGENAWLVAADQPVQAARALIKVLQNPRLTNSMASQALKTASLFTWETRAKKIATWIQKNLNGG